MFCRGCSPVARVGNESICSNQSDPHSSQGHGAQGESHHFDGSIRQVNELGQDLAILAGSIELGGIPQRQVGADELGEALGPCSLNVRTSLCITTGSA